MAVCREADWFGRLANDHPFGTHLAPSVPDKPPNLAHTVVDGVVAPIQLLSSCPLVFCCPATRLLTHLLAQPRAFLDERGFPEDLAIKCDEFCCGPLSLLDSRW